MEKKHRHLIMALLIAALLVIFFLLLPAETRQEMIDRLRPRWLTSNSTSKRSLPIR